MTELKNGARRADKLRVWFEGHQVWAFFIVILLAAVSIGFAFQQSASQGDRATAAADKVVAGERTARTEQNAQLALTIHTIAVTAHSALYSSCVRGQAGRIANHDNALHGRQTARSFATYLRGVVERQSQVAADPKTLPDVRARARDALADAEAQLNALDLNPSIPPLPPKCVDVIPSVAQFETIAKAASGTK